MHRRTTTLALLLTLLLAPSWAAAQATRIRSSGTLPATCSVGNIYLKTGASAGFYVCLTTNTWTAVGATPGGADTQVQFNDSGVFGGDAGLTYNKTTNALTGTGDWTVGDQLIVSGVGPHAIGGIANLFDQLLITGTFTGGAGDDTHSLEFTPTLNVAADNRGRILHTSAAATFVEAASGVHPILSAIGVNEPQVTAGAATVTDTATLYVRNQMTATVTGANRAFWVDGGRSDLDGTVFLSGISAGAAGDTDACLNATTNEVTDAGASTCIVSSLRYKSDWKPLIAGALASVSRLTPGSFYYTNDPKKTPRIGLNAENMHAVEPRLAFYEADGVTPRGVAYEETVALLVKAIQELEARLRVVEARRTAP